MTTDINTLIEVATRMAEDLQRYHDAGVEAGCSIPTTRQLLAEWQITLNQYLNTPQPTPCLVLRVDGGDHDENDVRNLVEQLLKQPNNTRH